MISDKLLSEVLGKNRVNGIKTFGMIPESTLLLMQFEGYDDTINIHELAHKCKEWADYKSYYLHSGRCHDNGYFDKFGTTPMQRHWEHGIMKVLSMPINCPVESFRSKTEPEAIFKACQWILEKE